jgi:hypothetical protein
MRRITIALPLLLAALPVGAQLQTFPADPVCTAGAVFTYVNSTTGVARKCVNGTTSNVVAASEVGSLACTQLPAHTGNVTSSAGSCALTIGAAQVTNAMLAGSITDANLASNYSGVGSCTNQVVTATVDNAAPTCTTLTSAYVNNSIALTGVDVNTSNQVTATHLAAALPVAQGGTGVATHTQGAVITGGNGTAAEVDLADVAAGSVLTSGGTSTIPAWRAAATCTSSAATTCTITGQRAGCLPVCSMTTSVSTTFRAALASTTITCTFGTSGSNTCNCLCI